MGVSNRTLCPDPHRLSGSRDVVSWVLSTVTSTVAPTSAYHLRTKSPDFKTLLGATICRLRGLNSTRIP